MGVVIETDLEIAFAELLKLVMCHHTIQSSRFETLLKRLENTLKSMEPVLFYRPEKETIMFIFYLENGKDLVLKCSKIQWWNVYKKFVHAKRLIRLNSELLRFFQTEMQVKLVSNSIRSLIGIHDLKEKLDRVLSAVTTPVAVSSGSCTVPGIPQLIVGLDLHLEELKHKLMKDETQVLVVSGFGGCGKTTLVKMLCYDNEIKDIYGENIFYVTVSRPSSMKTVAQKLFEHHGENHCKFQTDEEAKNQLENLMWQMQSDKMLLILDDVWSESESLIQDLKFQIPGYKIVVTSRFLFPRFNSTYELSLMNNNDARDLLCHSAFPGDGIPVNVPDDLVNKIVMHCNGLPLALTVVGASLCGQGAIKWRTTFKKWSEGQSILQSHNRILVSLKASIDALDYELPIVKECFLDLGLFPKDERITATAVNDMWVELYNHDGKGMYTIENLRELSLRNLVHLVPIRKDVGELEGYCDEHYVTQHDFLRELVIHLSSQEPITQRKRLFIEIRKNNFPTWWTEQIRQPINARILSISTGFLSSFSPFYDYMLPIFKYLVTYGKYLTADEAFSSNWYDLKAPKVEVLVLNIMSKQYSLPEFIESMEQLKVLSFTSYGINPAKLHNLPSIGVLSNLKRIRFEHLSVSTSIQAIFALQNLQKLSFVMCELGNALMNDTTESPMLPNLTDLEFDRCYDLKELPAGLCSLIRLQKLSITNCHELDVLPKDLGSLLNLEFLRLNCCTKLEELPESIGNLLNLSFMDISDCLSISLLPEEIGELCSLRVVKMSGCRGLQDLPLSMSKLLQLEEVICDEETSYLWMDFETDLCNLKINVVEDDRFESFMKIVQ